MTNSILRTLHKHHMGSHEMGTGWPPVRCITCSKGGSLVPQFTSIWILEATESKCHPRENPILLSRFYNNINRAYSKEYKAFGLTAKWFNKSLLKLFGHFMKTVRKVMLEKEPTY